MMSPFRNMLKGAFVYGVGDILLFGISYLVMIPMLTRYLTPEEYGIVATLNTVTIFLLAFFQFGLPSAGFRFWFMQSTPERQKSYMASILLTGIVAAGAVASTVLLLGRPIWEAAIERAPFEEFAPYVVTGAALQVVIAFKSVVLRALDRPRLFISFDIAQFLFMLGSVAYQVIVLKRGAIGQIQGVFITQLIFATLSLGVIIWICGSRVRADGILQSLKFAIPIMISSVVALVATRSTILITQHFVAGAAVGLFALGSQIGSLVQMAASSLEKAWQPFLYSRDPESARKSLGGLLRVAAPAYTLIALTLALFAPQIVAVLATHEYTGASVVAVISLFGALCFALSSIANGGLYYAAKSGVSMIVTVIAAGANVLFCWMLIPTYGIVGAAVATALAGLVSLTFMLAALQVSFGIRYPRVQLFGTMTLGMLLSWMGIFFSSRVANPLAISALGVNAILVVVYLVVIWKLKWYGAIRREDRQPKRHESADSSPRTMEVHQA
jgi:O-antigen/teichoic acid export membrane protein